LKPFLISYVDLDGLVEFAYSQTYSPPPIPTIPSFNNEDTPLKEGLPARLNSKGNILDLSFLSGDLDAPNRMSDVVQSILDSLAKNHLYQVSILAGVSRCGKTKTIFDVGKHHYIILLSFLEYTATDVQNCQYECEDALRKAKGTQDHPDYSEACRNAIEFMLFQRILAFVLLQFCYPQLTPWDWLLFQLEFAETKSPARRLLESIGKYIIRPSKDNWSGSLMSDLRSLQKIETSNQIKGQPFVIAVDEA
jgi:hypothetical protein